MDLQLIKTFLEVAQSGSFAAASERLFVTQSAVSLRVHRLEDQLGEPLFSRNSDGVSLTEAGDQFRPHAEALMHHWQEAQLAVTRAQSAQSLRIALPATLGYGLLPRWLCILTKEMPKLELVVNKGEEDVLLATHGRAKGGYQAEPLGEMELALFSANSGAYRLIDIDWGEEFADWQHALTHDGDMAALKLDAVEPALDLIRSGGFAAFLPLGYAPQEFQGLRPEQNFSLRIWAHWRIGLSEDLRNVAQTTLQRAMEQQKAP